MKNLFNKSVKKQKMNIEDLKTYMNKLLYLSILISLPLITDVLTQIPEISIDNGAIYVLGKRNIGYYINGKQTNLNPANIL
jgi:pilus assembly protein TadC